jgi:hypothetical protein
MARFRASGGLRPFGLMNGQAGQTRSQFGMFHKQNVYFIIVLTLFSSFSRDIIFF